MATEYLTMAEIEAKYPNEWVLIDKLKKSFWTKTLLGGIVVAHSPDRNEFERMISSTTNTLSKYVACFYMGKEDPDTVYLGLGSQLQIEEVDGMRAQS